MMITFSSMKSLLGRIGFIICLTLMVNGRCHGYVMPAEQMLDFMAGNFSNFKTVLIVQSTLQTGQDMEKVFMEQIQLKSPDLFEFKSLDRIAGRTDIPYMAYRQLLMANSRARIEQILSMMGINLQAVSLTRIDGVIAYRIGEKGDDIPKLLIEKERFLPLLLIYRTTGDMSEEVATVRFQDYRKEGKGWFPFNISYSVGNKIREEYSIQTLQINIPINSSLLQTFEITPSPGQTLEEEPLDIEGERLR
jgi:hypothetical protein